MPSTRTAATDADVASLEARLEEYLRTAEARIAHRAAQAAVDEFAPRYAQAGFDAAVRHYIGTGELVLGAGRAKIKTVRRDAAGRIEAMIARRLGFRAPSADSLPANR